MRLDTLTRELVSLPGGGEKVVRIYPRPTKCPRCKRKWKEDPRTGFRCPKCRSKPERLFVSLSWQGKLIRVYSDKQGNPIRDFRQAQRVLQLIAHELETGEFDPSKWVKQEAERFLVRNLIRDYLDERKPHMSPAGFRAKKTWLLHYIAPHLGHLDVREVRGYHLAEMMRRLQEPREADGKKFRKDRLSLSTIHKIFVELRAFLNWCRKRELIDRLPSFPEVKTAEPPIKFLTPEQQAAVLEAIPDEHKPIFAFLFATGCRVGEARALMWDCVYPDDGFLVIRRVFSDDHLKDVPKEGKQKAIPLVGVIRDVILHQAKRKRSMFVFCYEDPNRKGRFIPYPHKKLLKIFYEACRKVGVEGVSLYQASRHSFALQRLQQGFSYEEVGAALGHSSPQTTRRYARLRAEQVRSVFEGAKVIPFPKVKEKDD
ncbi:MAG TPA: hypothetical protein ENJ40_04515 [Thermosulfurimonas dismutans]|uniref:Tyr recombinase domain-containing protein n=1 Tax=Thermosulfurimonas dismutans TaxID=999894 RepID=A0A7C3CXV4_9BACT|nr:hypothetical protein [Thermosulfurimonas dismutans]